MTLRTQEAKVLIRESRPEAVVLPYNQFIQSEANWNVEFARLLTKNQKAFKARLKKMKVPYPKTEDQMYELIGNVSGRH